MRRRRILLVLLGLGLGLLVAEIGVRIYHSATGKVPPHADRSLEMEWDWARRHLEAGAPRFESDLGHDPDLGWVNLPNLRTEAFSTNAQGMRGARDVPPDKGDAKRILFVGDSYTWGLHVRDDETYPAALEAMLPEGWEVYNLAVSGTGTDQQILTLEKLGLATQPDVVVLGFYVRDYGRNQLRFLHYAKPLFEVVGDGLQLTNVPIAPPEALYAAYERGEREIGRRWSLWTWQTLTGELRKRRRRSLESGAPGWQVLSRLIQRFRATVESAGAQPVWVIIPSRDVTGDAPSRYAPLHALCREACAEVGVPCLDLGSSFRDRSRDGEPLYRPRSVGGHLSVQGHRVAAKALAAFLQSEGIVGE
jgi:lysophospholipase L1-like esterase